MRKDIKEEMRDFITDAVTVASIVYRIKNKFEPDTLLDYTDPNIKPVFEAVAINALLEITLAHKNALSKKDIKMAKYNIKNAVDKYQATYHSIPNGLENVDEMLMTL